uniref:Putative ovule protein n=1 Tax=Solanum chacoense TaxID=4108 RepID=A0A0V0GTM9_SOLCH
MAVFKLLSRTIMCYMHLEIRASSIANNKQINSRFLAEKIKFLKLWLLSTYNKTYGSKKYLKA